MYDSFSEGRLFYGHTALLVVAAVAVSVLLRLI